MGHVFPGEPSLPVSPAATCETCWTSAFIRRSGVALRVPVQLMRICTGPAESVILVNVQGVKELHTTLLIVNQ